MKFPRRPLHPNKSLDRNWKLILLLLVALCSQLMIQAQAGMGKQRVLVLHSYHQGFQWTDRINAGIQSVFSDKPNVELFINYMDTKRISNAAYFEQLKNLYATKYSKINFDAIISSDDNALDFLLTYRDRLFPGVPVIFSGLNAFPEDRLQGQQGFTGIYESYDVSGTLNLMLRLHPNTKTISVVTDNTRSGRIFKNLVENSESQLKSSVRINYLHNESITDLQRKLVMQPRDSLALWAIYIRTPSNESLSIQESVRLVSSFSPVPTYCVWDVVGQGVVGGKITSPNYQGEYAAKTALRVLNGETVDDIKVVGSPLVNIFDYQVMKKFGIKPIDIPDPKIIINQPQSFYSKYQSYIWFYSILLVVLVSIVFLFTRNYLLKKQQQQFREMALRDQLTGLYNRHYLEEIIPLKLAEARRHNTPLSLLALDLDRFKQINDTFGHATGDKVLEQFAALLSSHCRSEDIVARLGGEEFVILLSQCNTQNAKDKAELIRQDTEYLKPDGLTITVSIGVSELKSNEEDIENALHRADKAVYLAKDRGRNCVVVG